MNTHYIEESSRMLHLTLIPAPTPVQPLKLPYAPAFVAKEDAVIERIYLVAGERRVSRKDVVMKNSQLHTILENFMCSLGSRDTNKVRKDFTCTK